MGELPRAVTVDTVRAELEAGSTTHSYLDTAIAALDDEIPVVTPSAQAQEIEATVLETLDPGEAQALAVAEAADGTVVTDDGDARTVATRRDVRLTGSIGLLVRFVERGTISADVADRYLKRWIDEAGFRVTGESRTKPVLSGDIQAVGKVDLHGDATPI